MEASGSQPDSVQQYVPGYLGYIRHDEGFR